MEWIDYRDWDCKRGFDDIKERKERVSEMEFESDDYGAGRNPCYRCTYFDKCHKK